MALVCLKQDFQDEQDEQDGGAQVHARLKQDCQDCDDAAVTRSQGLEDLNVYSSQPQQREKVRRTLMAIDLIPR